MSPDALCSTTISTPLGAMTLVASSKGLRAVRFPGERPDRLALGPVVDTSQADTVAGSPTRDTAAVAILTSASTQLLEYFAGDRRTFDLALDARGTPFQHRVWAVLATIPYGHTLTYGEQATRLGDVQMARAVGTANGQNPLGIVVPCHRVIGASGHLTGFGGGLEAKAWLLRHEQGIADLWSSSSPAASTALANSTGLQ